MPTIEFTYGIKDIESIARELLSKLKTKTLLFYGDMGVGKTTLIKALSKELGSSALGKSPTFSIVNEYEIPDDLIYHFDLYRIKDENEALNFGMEEYLFSEHWLFIEWPEKLGNLLPDLYDQVEIKQNNNGSRTLKLKTADYLTNKSAQMQ